MLRLWAGKRPQPETLSPFSPWDYGAVCLLSRAALTPGLELWRQEDSKGRLLALVQEGGALCLAPRYAGVSPLLKGELRDFLSHCPKGVWAGTRAGGLLGLDQGEAGELLGLEQAGKEGSPAFPPFVGEREAPDSRALWEFLCRVFPSFPEKGEEAFRAYYARGLGQGRITSLGFWRRGELVAAATVTRYGDAGILENLAVDPSCQGKGLGRSLVGALLSQPGVPGRLMAACSPALSPFYHKLGFSPKGGFCLWKA